MTARGSVSYLRIFFSTQLHIHSTRFCRCWCIGGWWNDCHLEHAETSQMEL